VTNATVKKAQERGGFLDPFFALFRRKVPPQETQGTGGTASFGGWIQSIEKDPALQGAKRWETFSNLLLNVSIVAAGTRYFLNLVGKASWKFEPADDSPQAKEAAELMESVVHDMTTPWHRVVRRAAMYKFYGFSTQEWTAKKRDDGKVGLLDVEPRPQKTIERWDLDATGTVYGVVQRNVQDSSEIYIPRSKLLYMVDDSLTDSPEGVGLLRHCADASRRLARLEELEGVGYETDLRGVPLVRAPLAKMQELVKAGTIKQQQADSMKAALQKFVENHIKGPKSGLLLDSMTYQSLDAASTPSSVPLWAVELLTSGGDSQADIGVAITRTNTEIARILGVESLLLGQERGSYALSRDKSHNFALTVDSTLTEMAASVRADLCAQVCALNGIDKQFIPKPKTEPLRWQDVEQVTGALETMARAGATLSPDDPAINEVRDLLGVSRPITVNTDVDASLLGDGKPGRPGNVPGESADNPDDEENDGEIPEMDDNGSETG